MQKENKEKIVVFGIALLVWLGLYMFVCAILGYDPLNPMRILW